MGYNEQHSGKWWVLGFDSFILIGVSKGEDGKEAWMGART